jgi:hypothetical protein
MERTRWSDDRIDDLAGNIAKSFDLLRDDIGRLDGRLERLDAKFDALRRDVFLAAVAILVCVLGALATAALI